MRPRLNAAKVDVSLSVMFKAFHVSAAKFSVVQSPSSSCNRLSDVMLQSCVIVMETAIEREVERMYKKVIN